MKTDLMMLCRLGVAPALAALVLAGCGSAKPASASPPPQVSVVTVHRGSVPITTELPGRTSAYLVAQVRARVDGIVLKRDFKEGGDVKAGQRLYQIDPAPYIAALNSATASLQKAEANLASTTAQAERYKVLVAANAVSKQDYDNAVAAQGAGRGRRGDGQGGGGDGADQPWLHERDVADHRSQRSVAGHARVRTCRRAPRRS